MNIIKLFREISKTTYAEIELVDVEKGKTPQEQYLINEARKLNIEHVFEPNGHQKVPDIRMPGLLDNDCKCSKNKHKVLLNDGVILPDTIYWFLTPEHNFLCKGDLLFDREIDRQNMLNSKEKINDLRKESVLWNNSNSPYQSYPRNMGSLTLNKINDRVEKQNETLKIIEKL